MDLFHTLDANEAVARVAYQVSEVIAIYPITPSSPMGEWSDQWASEGRENLWGVMPQIAEMQSEGGAAGAVHGAVMAGALATTFTASQGLLLMIPNMYKIAGELTPFVMHVAARTLATHALSIFGDHSDVMATRQTGFAMLASNSVQEAHDLALIAHAATLQTRLPFLHFFDGFRTSHEVAKIREIQKTTIRSMISEDLVKEHRARGLNPEGPELRGTAQNPDVFFQAREACQPYYDAAPQIIQRTMDRFSELTGRSYNLFDYEGAPDAERVIVIMGSGAETVGETVEALNGNHEKVGVLKVRLYRPFSTTHFLDALPPTTRAIAVLDRTKEPGATGEPLYQDVITTIAELMSSQQKPFDQMPTIIGGRYGLSSKEFTPAMVKAIFDELTSERPQNHFTVGINDDVSHKSLRIDKDYRLSNPGTVEALFYGLGSDGTVGANKNSIKIIGEQTENYAQGYFVYDSKKSGAMTVSHLRFGPRDIRSPYLISSADFLAIHQFGFLDRFDMLTQVKRGGVVLLQSPYGPADVWDQLPADVQKQLIDKEVRLYVIDAEKVAMEAGLGRRINTVMQACFFAISGVLPKEESIAQIKKFIDKTYGKRGAVIVEKNFAAVDAAVGNLYEVAIPHEVTSKRAMRPLVSADAPEYVRSFTAEIIAGRGDELPVSAFLPDGTFPTGTTQYEKRCIASEVPVWDPDVCIQCGKCVAACPHGVIRSAVYTEGALEGAPEGFLSTMAKWPEHKDKLYTLAISTEDCTGCSLCVEVCPAKNKSASGRKAINMEPVLSLKNEPKKEWEFFRTLPLADRTALNRTRVKDLQLMEPLFEFSGACAGCGETPYLKMVTQLFGERMIVANATGCSSIYGGNLPTTPWTKTAEGRGPAWANSLFEDNAEFGFGMRLSMDQRLDYASTLLKALEPQLGQNLIGPLLYSRQVDEAEIAAQRERIDVLKQRLDELEEPEAQMLLNIADIFLRRSVWIIGGDGWAYDIDYGGLDHVLASGRDVNIMVLDTEVYSNTGGQSSKATPRAAVAKFAASGKSSAKKDIALMAMTYGNVYVARVAMGANDAHTIKVLLEAEAWQGPSLILAYSHCIAHGFNLAHGFEQQKKAVNSGHWPLMRYNPALVMEGKSPFTLDSKAPSIKMKEYAYNETRYAMLAHGKPELAAKLMSEAQADSDNRWNLYEQLAMVHGKKNNGTEEGSHA